MWNRASVKVRKLIVERPGEAEQSEAGQRVLQMSGDGASQAWKNIYIKT